MELVARFQTSKVFQLRSHAPVFSLGLPTLNNVEILTLDAIVNPGFSGGPVFAITDTGEVTVCGVVSGYKYEKPQFGQLFQNTMGKEECVPDHYVKLNSALTNATPLAALNSLFSGSSFGIPVKKQT